MTRRQVVFAAIGGVLVCAVLVVVAVQHLTAQAPPDAAHDAPTTAAAHVAVGAAAVRPLAITNAALHWAPRGFMQMVPPVRLPSSPDESDQIAVWISVPDGAKIDVRMVETGAAPSPPRALLVWPVGTVADRVERLVAPGATAPAQDVTDVRGTTITPVGELFHIYVAAAGNVGGTLRGWEWPRGDAVAEQTATQALIAQLAANPWHDSSGSIASPLEQERRQQQYKRNNICARCHMANMPPQLTRREGIHRGTDTSGWYVAQSVLEGKAPLETHRPRDLNVGDPLLTIRCNTSGEAPHLFDDGRGGRHLLCGESDVPMAVLDVQRGLKESDPRTLGVCASRRWLYARMTDAARAAFQNAFTECGV